MQGLLLCLFSWSSPRPSVSDTTKASWAELQLPPLTMITLSRISNPKPQLSIWLLLLWVHLTTQWVKNKWMTFPLILVSVLAFLVMDQVLVVSHVSHVAVILMSPFSSPPPIKAYLVRNKPPKHLPVHCFFSLHCDYLWLYASLFLGSIIQTVSKLFISKILLPSILPSY